MHPQVLPLESRQLFAAILIDTVLTINASSARDRIEIIRLNSDLLHVEINGVRQTFKYSAVARFEIFAGRGNDLVRFDGIAIDKRTRIEAGAGDDFVRGTLARDTIFGGSGDDTIDGREGSDVLYGQGGDDVLIGRSGNDKMFGSGGADRMIGGKGLDMMVGGGDGDDLDGGLGQDLIAGGSGNDDFDSNDTFVEIVDQNGEDLGPNELRGV